MGRVRGDGAREIEEELQNIRNWQEKEKTGERPLLIKYTGMPEAVSCELQSGW